MDNGAFEIDYTGGFDLSEDFFLGINGAYFDGGENSPGFAGVALYPQLATSENFTIGLRGEYFAETEILVQLVRESKIPVSLPLP